MDYVAFQYAEALFGLALEKKNVEEIRGDFKELVDTLDTDFYMFMAHPNMKNKVKKNLIDEVVDTTLLKHLCYVLIDNHRINLMPEVFESYLALINDDNQVMDVDAFSKKPLREEALEKLIVALEKRFSKKVQLHNIVDEEIIGGVRLEYNGAVLDDTVNHYFKDLQTRLTK